MEEERKTGKVSVSVVLLIIALIVIFVMGILIFKLNNDKRDAEAKVTELNNTVSQLNNKVANLQETIDSVANVINNNSTDKFNIKNVTIEKGYTEMSLTNKEKATINKALYDEFKIGNGGNPVTDIVDYKVNENRFANDGMKLLFAKWYITCNNNANYKFEKESYKNDFGNECYKMKYSRLEEITKEMFNVEQIVCTDSKFEEVIPDKEGYIGLDSMEGGWIPIAIKTISKYKNGDNYYLLIHMYNPREEDIDYNNLEEYLTSYNDTSEESGYANNYSKYVKLKYGINEGKKYLISYEYLN